MDLLRRLAETLPPRWQYELKRLQCHRAVKRSLLSGYEPEYYLLPILLGGGDWVVDVGAHIGQYTLRCAELVGTSGRVIAFEANPETFALLTCNMQRPSTGNVTLINAALSDRKGALDLPVSPFSFRQDHECSSVSGYPAVERNVLTVALDCLSLAGRVTLVRIDVEYEEEHILRGMEETVRRDHPVVIIKTTSERSGGVLGAMDYDFQRLEGSPNLLCVPPAWDVASTTQPCAIAGLSC